MKRIDLAWSDEIESWQKSGLSQAEYCRRRGISSKGFTYRLMKSRRSQEVTTRHRSHRTCGKGRNAAGFIEITREEPQKSEYSIRTKAGRELVIRGSIEARELRTLLEVLESC